MQEERREYSNQTVHTYQSIDQDEDNKGGEFGFKGRMFPLLGCVIGMITVLGSYYVARHNSPPDVPPFPKTDITHTGIKFPEYTIMRIGLMVCAPLFSISFQVLKNYLNIWSFKLTGQSEPSVNKFGWLGVISCLALATSTASMSDGGDMNWTLHVIGATSFFIITLYMIMVASKVYRKLWHINHFCSYWSYQIKKYTNFFIIAFIAMQLMEQFKMIEIYALVEWLATFFIMAYFFTLYFDLKDMNIVLMRKK